MTDDLKDTMTRRDYYFVGLWAAGILLLYAVGGYLGVRTLLTYRAETEKFRQTWIGSATTEPDVRTPEIKMAPGAKPFDVLVGIYINSIGEISLKESAWTADFDIWFRWTDFALAFESCLLHNFLTYRVIVFVFWPMCYKK